MDYCCICEANPSAIRVTVVHLDTSILLDQSELCISCAEQKAPAFDALQLTLGNLIDEPVDSAGNPREDVRLYHCPNTCGYGLHYEDDGRPRCRSCGARGVK